MFSQAGSGSGQSLKLLVVEDHPVYLEGLSTVLDGLADHVLQTRVTDVESARNMLAAGEDFDLITLDLGLPGGGSMELIQYVSSQELFIPVVILSASENPEDVDRSIKAGASGFISKSLGKEAIIESLNQVLSGDTVTPDFYENWQQSGPGEISVNLTPRQREVLLLLAEGLPNKRICQRLNLTEHTVKTHLKTLFSQLDVHTRTECVRVATELGLI